MKIAPILMMVLTLLLLAPCLAEDDNVEFEPIASFSAEAMIAQAPGIEEQMTFDSVFDWDPKVDEQYVTWTQYEGQGKVWFYDMQADGFSLDDKRTVISDNDIPDVIERWHNLEAENKRKRTDKSFMVPVDDIRKEKYDLSINRYKQIVYDEVKYDKPKDILAEIMKMEKEIQKGLEELDGMLG